MSLKIGLILLDLFFQMYTMWLKKTKRKALHNVAELSL